MRRRAAGGAPFADFLLDFEGFGPAAQARSRQCAAEGCTRRPVFNHAAAEGVPAPLPLLCQDHKEPGMVDVLNRLCTFPGAPESPQDGPNV